MSMSDSFSNQEGYTFSQQNAADEPYFHAGTHRLPQTPNNIPSTQQIEQDIDDGLQQFPLDFCSSSNNNSTISQTLDEQLDLSNLDLPIDFPSQSWMSDIANPVVDPSIQSGAAFATGSQDTFVPQPVKRINSDLRATAKTFVPASQQQWPDQQMVQWTSQNLQAIQGFSPSNNTMARQSSTNNNMRQPSRDWMSHMTPLQTKFNDIYHTPPESAPRQLEIHTAQPMATSPMISVTNDMSLTTSIPQHPSRGYQWTFTTPPALDIDTWAHGTRDFVNASDLLQLPDTPISPAYGGSSLERTTSRTSRTSRTTNGPFFCDHEGCGKDFKTKTEISHHKRNHGERHHVCEICQKRFVFRKDCNRHKKTHTGDRQMFGDIVEGCAWCAKGFQRKDHYDRHMLTHLKKADALTPACSSDAMSRSQSRQ